MTEGDCQKFAYSINVFKLNIELDGGCTVVTHCSEPKESELAGSETVEF